MMRSQARVRRSPVRASPWPLCQCRFSRGGGVSCAGQRAALAHHAPYDRSHSNIRYELVLQGEKTSIQIPRICSQ
ncbi:hypothetical protein E2C01_061956 [Portunus trituberculatus]|uniref:Uncharacterized protein n=1 Tax=Portunus trituberculatus TaxID=210409 RepID=A0A5B7H9P1_PORTR|nr:hypothetical protein [Portunus trituberculatus]